MPYPPDYDETNPPDDAEPDAEDDAGENVGEAIQDAVADAGDEAEPVLDDPPTAAEDDDGDA